VGLALALAYSQLAAARGRLRCNLLVLDEVSCSPQAGPRRPPASTFQMDVKQQLGRRSVRCPSALQTPPCWPQPCGGGDRGGALMTQLLLFGCTSAYMFIYCLP
jgi:hypothetical protein